MSTNSNDIENLYSKVKNNELLLLAYKKVLKNANQKKISKIIQNISNPILELALINENKNSKLKLFWQARLKKWKNIKYENI